MDFDRRLFSKRLEEFDSSIYNIEKKHLILRNVEKDKTLFTWSFSMNLTCYMEKNFLEN